MHSNHTAFTTDNALFLLLYNVTLTYGAVSSRPAGQTFTVAVPVVTCGVVGTVDTHFRALLAIIASWTNCNTHTMKPVKWPALAYMETNVEYSCIILFLVEIRKAYSNCIQFIRGCVIIGVKCQPWSQLGPVYPERQSHSPDTWWQRYDWPQDRQDILHWSPYIPALHSGRQRDKE